MITIHHLNNSRSQRIIWLAEELGLQYQVCQHQRDAKTSLAPNSLKAVHPLGRAPVVCDGDLVLVESAAIVEYLIDKYDTEKRFAVPQDAALKHQYQFWMHFAEGSLMPAAVANLVLTRGKEKVGFPFSVIIKKFVDGVINAYFGPNFASSVAYVEQYLAEHHGFVGPELSAADVQMIFPLETIVASGKAKNLPAITAYVTKIHQREAYKRALERGGPYAYATST